MNLFFSRIKVKIIFKLNLKTIIIVLDRLLIFLCEEYFIDTVCQKVLCCEYQL